MFSIVVRRTHMYIGLFLMPWILMYGLSTIVMNHRVFFKNLYGGTLVNWVKEREQPFAGQFSPQTTAPVMAEQILRDLRLEGNYNANLTKTGAKLTITRTDPVTPRRITYIPADGKLLIERQEFRTQPFLESLHRRRGYQHRYNLDNVWGFMVDVAIVGILIWVASGVWMWWELKATRRLGLLAVAIGAGLFTLFVFTI